jgi:hypothetical protein
MLLIDNAKQWYKMFSLQANALNMSFLGTWAILPPRFQDVLPIPVVIGIAVALLLLGTMGRLIQQPSVEKPSGTNG